MFMKTNLLTYIATRFYYFLSVSKIEVQAFLTTSYLDDKTHNRSEADKL
jgi:hypothetical protein